MRKQQICVAYKISELTPCEDICAYAQMS